MKNVINQFNRLSITARLTWFYSVAIVSLICIIALLLYGTIMHVVHSADAEFLSSEVKILTKILKKDHLDHVILEHKILEVPETETGSSYHYYIRLLNEKSNTVLESDGMESIFAATEFFKSAVTQKSVTQWQSKNGSHYLLIRAPIFNGETKSIWQVQIALDISHQQALLSQWRMTIIFLTSIIAFFAVLSGIVITRNGMKSLHQLIEKTKKITASSLHKKIKPELWPAELKVLGISFNEMLERIEIAFARLNQFSGDLAHELRTPINNMMGQTEIALSNAKTVDECLNLLESNYEELQRISQIIENILFLARAENHQIELQKSELNVPDEINLLFKFYQMLAEEKNIALLMQGEAMLTANSVMFRRMISNLLSNALKYTQEGGTISCEVLQNEKDVRIKIKDDGAGIAAEHLPHIFTRFYRTDAARSHLSGGTGLGLAIVKSIVELHLGSISMLSELNQGTEVLIVLPV